MDRETGPLADFETFLSKLGTIPEGKIKFYLYWIWRFLKTCNYQSDSINTKHVSDYLDSLEADEKTADWQVRQAADAVILYVEKYFKRSLQEITPKGPGAKPAIKTGASPWQQTLDEVKNAIRLRHYSLSTEKT